MIERRKAERRGAGHPLPFKLRRIEFRDRRNRQRVLIEGDGRRIGERRSDNDRRQEGWQRV